MGLNGITNCDNTLRILWLFLILCKSIELVASKEIIMDQTVVMRYIVPAGVGIHALARGNLILTVKQL